MIFKRHLVKDFIRDIFVIFFLCLSSIPCLHNPRGKPKEDTIQRAPITLSQQIVGQNNLIMLFCCHPFQNRSFIIIQVYRKSMLHTDCSIMGELNKAGQVSGAHMGLTDTIVSYAQYQQYLPLQRIIDHLKQCIVFQGNNSACMYSTCLICAQTTPQTTLTQMSD